LFSGGVSFFAKSSLTPGFIPGIHQLGKPIDPEAAAFVAAVGRCVDNRDHFVETDRFRFDLKDRAGAHIS
jgi:hypothetical protein